MLARLRLFGLLALAVCSRGVRDDGEQHTAVISAGGRLSSADVGSRASGVGTHVCCATFARKKSGKTERLAASVNVYHESATRDIAKCAMKLLTGEACTDQSSCLQDCKNRIRSSKRYNLAVEKAFAQREEDQAKEIDKLKADAKERYEVELQELTHQYQGELQASQDKATKAEEAVSAAKQHLEDAQRRYEEVKREVEEAPAKVEAATSEYSRTAEELSEAKQAALEKYEKGKRAVGDASAEASAQAESELQELQKKTAAVRQRLAELPDDPPVPAACQGNTQKHGAYAAVPCCCSIGGIPMVVDGQFLDWARCKSPTRYKRSALGRLDFAGLTACSPYQECAKCRELVCGKGMCPN